MKSRIDDGKKYDHTRIEKKWQTVWEKEKINQAKDPHVLNDSTDTNSKTSAKKFYALIEFPYPSGDGLHVGHIRSNTAMDIIARKRRREGYNVLYPIGWDAFGLPTENYAIKTGIQPALVTKKNTDTFRRQLKSIGFSFDWSREINTTDPKYYRWTQWIFLQFLKAGLAYKKKMAVNWCPKDLIVLANEEVIDGKCERCGTPVEKREKEQWMLGITKYADKLLEGLDAVDYSDSQVGTAGTSAMPQFIDKVNPHQPGKPIIKRYVAHGIVFDPQTKKYLIIRNKKFGWDTVVIGGIEKGESVVDTARREVREETGYVDLDFKRILGGPTEAQYYTKHKGENRIAIAQAVLFELKNSGHETRVPIADVDDKDKSNEILWVDEADFVPGKMVNSELPIWLARMSVEVAGSDVLCFTQITDSSAWKENAPVVERQAIAAIVKHWSEDKYIGLKWKKVDWQTLITGGPEGKQTPEEGAATEIIEETGYLHPQLVRHLGHVDARFFHVPKGVNRFAHFNVMYFELSDGEQRELTDEEKANHDVVWLSREEMSDFISPASQKYIWDTLFLGKPNWFAPARPLLDWAKYIKEAQRNWIGRSEGAEIDFEINFKKDKTNKTRFVLIHGFEGSSHADFFPWLKTELEKRGHEVEVPELPNSSKPTETEQVNYVLKNCHFDEQTVVIGHSLGAVVAMKALMKLNKPISGLVIVAAAVDPKFHTDAEDSRPFDKEFSWDFDYPLIRQLTGGKIAVLSDTREDFRMPYLRDLAEKLPARLVETTAADEHFCAEKEPEILKAVTPSIPIFTTRADTLFGVTYLVLAPEHPWVNILLSHVENKKEVEKYIATAKGKTDIIRTDLTREKTGVELKGIYAVNPANGEKVPVWIADYVLADYGTGAVMAVPAHDERDFDFAKKYRLPIKQVIEKPKGETTLPYTGEGIVINSEKFPWMNGLLSEDAREEIIGELEYQGLAKEKITYKLRDWVFSRQRYWGEPIPVISCIKCGLVPVPDKDLPVELPPVKNYKPTETGESPLAAISKWVNVKCPRCGGKAKRETDTMPNWAGSSWYYLRYTDLKNVRQFAAPDKLTYWMPVDWYNGGNEHTTLHLLYSRFWHRFLYDQGLVPTPEPYRKRTSNGLILAKGGEKMSKSKGNVVNPDGIVETVGADALRLYEMFMGPFDQAIVWDENGIVGTRRFIEKVWKLRQSVGITEKIGNAEEKIDRLVHVTVKKVSEDIEAMHFNTAVSALMILVNSFEDCAKENAGIDIHHYEILLQLLAPFAPHVTEELWHNLGHKNSIHAEAWPTYDPDKIAETKVRIAVQINGKSRAAFEALADEPESVIREKALTLDEIKNRVYGKDIKKVIYVKGRLINIVIS